MRRKVMAATVVAASTLSPSTSHAQTAFGKWTLVQATSAQPKATLSVVDYAPIEGVELLCAGGRDLSIKILFRGAPQNAIQVGGDEEALASNLRVGPDGVVVSADAAIFAKRVEAAERAGETAIGGMTQTITGFSPVRAALRSACENYFKVNPTPVAVQPAPQTSGGRVNLKSFDAAASAVQSAFAPGECQSFLMGADLGGGPEVRCKLQLNKAISGITSPGMQVWVQANEPYSRPNKGTKLIAIFMDQYGFLPQNRGAAIDRILKVANALGAKSPGQIAGAFNNGYVGDPELDGAPRMEFNCQSLNFCRMFIAP